MVQLRRRSAAASSPVSLWMIFRPGSRRTFEESVLKLTVGRIDSKRWTRWVVALGLAAALPACAAAPPVITGRHAAEIVLPDEPEALIQMRRQGCATEPCPIYAVSIFSDGTAVYDGRANVGVIGRRQARLPAGDLSALISALDAMDFLDSATNCCVCPEAADQRLITLDYRPGSVTKTVLHDQRCSKAPPAFSALEKEIDLSTGAGRLASLPAHSDIALGSTANPSKR
jgi:hypothetical protein